MYWSIITYLLFPDCLEKDWTLPIYVFFICMPCNEYVDKCQVYIFVCAAFHCKAKYGRDVQHFP